MRVRRKNARQELRSDMAMNRPRRSLSAQGAHNSKQLASQYRWHQKHFSILTPGVSVSRTTRRFAVRLSPAPDHIRNKPIGICASIWTYPTRANLPHCGLGPPFYQQSVHELRRWTPNTIHTPGASADSTHKVNTARFPKPKSCPSIWCP
jgi:hypothetical protein